MNTVVATTALRGFAPKGTRRLKSHQSRLLRCADSFRFEKTFPRLHPFSNVRRYSCELAMKIILTFFLTSQVQAGLPGFAAGTIPGGWPNGRRFGDDVIDIAVTAVISDLRNNPLVINGPAGDNVNGNDAVYNKVFPCAGTPHNGRNHTHH